MSHPDLSITKREYDFLVWLDQHPGEFHHSELPESSQPVSFALGHRKPPLAAHGSDFRLYVTNYGKAAISAYEYSADQQRHQRAEDEEAERAQIAQHAKDVDQKKSHVALVKALTFLASVLAEQFIGFLNLPLRALEYIKSLFLR